MCDLVLAAAPVAPGAFVYTEAPKYDVQAGLGGGERFPAGAKLRLYAPAGSRAVVPGFVASADAALSFDAERVLFAGKERAGDAWQVWEMPLSGGKPRRVTNVPEDCIRPFYLPEERIVYARKTPPGFQMEIVPLAGGAPVRLTYVPGNQIPDAVLSDGRVLYEAPHPAAGSSTGDIFTVFTDGSGVETYRCDHGNPMAEVGESADDTIVALCGVLSRQRNDEGLNLGLDRAAARIRATFGTVEFLDNQSALPRQYGVRKRDGGGPLKFLAAKPCADLSQSEALRIGKSQARRKMRAQDAILGDQAFILQERALIHQARK